MGFGSSLDKRGRLKLIKDPVHGYVELNLFELRIVDTRVFQRLRRIGQLPLAYLVYPGARHSRFDHSLGSFHLAKEYASHLGLDEYRSKVVTVAALLHDIGHTPYSHLLESLLLEHGVSHEDISIKFILEEPELASAIEDYGIRPRDVADVLLKKTRESSIISGPVDVDRLDYLVRDSYFTGAMYGLIDTRRIIRLSAFVDGKLVVNIRGLGAIEELAIARLQSFLNIYFHHATRGAQQLLLNAVKKLEDELNLANMSVEEYIEHDDLTVWALLRSNNKTREIIKRLENRRLPKRVYETRVIGEHPHYNILKNRDIQAKVAEEIAHEAGIDPSLVWIDTPYVPPVSTDESVYVPFFVEEGEYSRLVEVESPFLKQVREAFNIIRVYTDSAEREKVTKAAARFFGQPTLR